MHQLQSDDPIRVDLFPGAFAMMAPITSADWLKARQAAREAIASAAPEDPDLGIRIRTALLRSLVQSGIRTLDGVADVDGTPIEGRPTEEQVDRLLAWWPAYESLERLYAGPINEAEAEKNGFAPSPGGNSTPRAAKATAGAASKPTGDDATSAPPT
jgi:hypothetical protein